MDQKRGWDADRLQSQSPRLAGLLAGNSGVTVPLLRSHEIQITLQDTGHWNQAYCFAPVALTTCETKHTGGHNTALQLRTTDLEHLAKCPGDVSPGHCPKSWFWTWSPHLCGVKQKSSRWETVNSKEQRAKQKTCGSEKLASQALNHVETEC